MHTYYTNLTFQVDTAGLERFHSSSLEAAKDTSAVVVIFDWLSLSSLVSADKWLEEITVEPTTTMSRDRAQRLFLCGNKADLNISQRIVTHEAASRVAAKYGTLSVCGK